MKIILISCVSQKLSHRARASELYTSSLFKLSLAYARSLNPDRIFILSAKYGLLSLEDEIEPYDLTLNSMPDRERREWTNKVRRQLEQVADLQNDQFIYLAGRKYYEYLVQYTPNHHLPLKGLGIGKRLKWLKERT